MSELGKDARDVVVRVCHWLSDGSSVSVTILVSSICFLILVKTATDDYEWRLYDWGGT